MNKAIIIIIAAVVAVNAGIYGYTNIQTENAVKVYISPEIQSSEGVNAIARQGITVVYEDIPDEGDDQINGQTTRTSYDRGQTWVVTKVAIDNSITNPYEINSIAWHEYYHVINENATEAQCDAYANEKEPNWVITDKYNGVH